MLYLPNSFSFSFLLKMGYINIILKGKETTKDYRIPIANFSFPQDLDDDILFSLILKRFDFALRSLPIEEKQRWVEECRRERERIRQELEREYYVVEKRLKRISEKQRRSVDDVLFLLGAERRKREINRILKEVIA